MRVRSITDSRIIRAVLLVICFASAALLAACGVDDIDISTYESERIELVGIGEETVSLSVAELKAMDCKTLKTESTSDKIGKVRATGPELDTVLGACGTCKSDFSKIIIKGSDEYDVKLQSDYFTEHDIYLAIGINGEPLDEESMPCRIIIPGSDSAYWVRMVRSIEFIK